jgi:23S rRNA (adenine2030-N6)-methyltransferase
VLIDPPFEKADEFQRLAAAVSDALQRFSNGVYLIWYPLKDEAAADRLWMGVRAFGAAKTIDVRLWVAGSGQMAGLAGTGLTILNPPYTLLGGLEDTLPVLANLLSQGLGGGFAIRTSGQDLGPER